MKINYIKKSCLGLVFLGMSILSVQAFGASCATGMGDYCNPCRRLGWYVGAGGGVVWHNKLDFKSPNFTKNTKYDVGGEGFISGGYMFDCWRLELEGAYRYSGIKKTVDTVGTTITENKSGHIKDVTLMVNGFYDFYFNNCFGAFIGAGVGIDFNQTKLGGENAGKKNNTLFAWQIMPGIFYDFTDQVTLDIGYRLFSTTKPKFRDSKADKVPFSHNLEARLRIKL